MRPRLPTVRSRLGQAGVFGSLVESNESPHPLANDGLKLTSVLSDCAGSFSCRFEHEVGRFYTHLHESAAHFPETRPPSHQPKLLGAFDPPCSIGHVFCHRERNGECALNVVLEGKRLVARYRPGREYLSHIVGEPQGYWKPVREDARVVVQLG